MQQTTFGLEGNHVSAITKAGPPARHSFGFTYDSKSMRAYLFGGKEYIDGVQLAMDDFWQWDGENWSEIEP